MSTTFCQPNFSPVRLYKRCGLYMWRTCQITHSAVSIYLRVRSHLIVFDKCIHLCPFIDPAFPSSFVSSIYLFIYLIVWLLKVEKGNLVDLTLINKPAYRSGLSHRALMKTDALPKVSQMFLDCLLVVGCSMAVVN